MYNSPSDRCGDCPWWHEGPIMCIDCPNHTVADRYILPCCQCKQFLFVSQLYEIDFEKKGLFLFCNQECKEEWDSFVTSEKQPFLEEQAFGSNPL